MKFTCMVSHIGNDISHALGDKSIFEGLCHPLFFIQLNGHHIGYEAILSHSSVSQAN